MSVNNTDVESEINSVLRISVNGASLKVWIVFWYVFGKTLLKIPFIMMKMENILFVRMISKHCLDLLLTKVKELHLMYLQNHAKELEIHILQNLYLIFVWKCFFSFLYLFFNYLFYLIILHFLIKLRFNNCSYNKNLHSR